VIERDIAFLLQLPRKCGWERVRSHPHLRGNYSFTCFFY